MPKTEYRQKKRRKYISTDGVAFRKTRNGGEAWDLMTASGRVTLVTSPSSVAAMDEATEIYAGALKRLAKR